MDSFSFTRTIEGHTITVRAIYIPRAQTWGLLGKLDGEVIEHRQSVSPWEDARSIIDAELAKLDLDLDEPEDEGLAA
jgi:hypothetical protein